MEHLKVKLVENASEMHHHRILDYRRLHAAVLARVLNHCKLHATDLELDLHRSSTARRARLSLTLS